jgi:hypothetical protein
MQNEFRKNMVYGLIPSFVIAIVTFVVYGMTAFSFIRHFQYQFLFIFLFSLIGSIFIGQYEKKIEQISHVILFSFGAFILMLIGSTGWLVSPFMFGVYMLIIGQSLLFHSTVPILQVGMLLIIVFAGTNNIESLDFLHIFTLLAIIPLSYFMKEKYLSIKEAQNSILILKKSDKQYADSVEELLDNVIYRFAAKIRESLSHNKMLVYRMETETDPIKQKQLRKEILDSTDTSLKLLKDFEEDTTGSKLISGNKLRGSSK